MTVRAPKQLRDVMQMSLVEKETAETIRDLWTKYHAPKPSCISMVIDKKNHESLQRNMNDSKIFIFPVHRKGGHFVLISEAQENARMVLFTFLEDYKKNGFLSSPWLVLNIFQETLNTKGIALVRGDIIDEKMSKAEASLLLKRYIMFYLTPELYSEHVYAFNNNQADFKYDSYMSLLKPERL